MSFRAIAQIDLSALRHNLDVVRRLVGHQRQVIAMIKANAYGHGLLPVAQSLNDADCLGVATLDEAIALREANIQKTIIVMTGFLTAEELQAIAHYDLSSVIHHPLQLELLEDSQFSVLKPLSVWLKVDTGMHRLGFSSASFKTAYDKLALNPRIQQPIQVMTHLADADALDHEYTNAQLQQFANLTATLPGLKSVGNSAGILGYRDSLLDVVRPGIMLYGASPFSNQTASDLNLKPVMRLSSKIIATKELKPKDRVGYGCTWECPEAMRMAIVGIGYGDGYPRHLEGASVLINQVLCPVVGRVSMDMITVDLRTQPNAQPGDEVLLWGEGLPIEKLAECAGTISYELFCQLTRRVKFSYDG